MNQNLIKAESNYQDALNSVNLKDTEQKEFFEEAQSFFLIPNNKFPQMFDQNSLASFLKEIILSKAFIVVITKNSSFETFITALEGLERVKHSLVSIVAINKGILHLLKKDKDNNIFLRNLKQIVDYIELNNIKCLRGNKKSLKHAIHLWKKNISIDKIFQKEDFLLDYFYLDKDILFPLWALFEYDVKIFVTVISKLTSPILFRYMTHSYFFDDFNKLLSIVKFSPVIVDEKMNWTGNLVAPVFVKAFVNKINETYIKQKNRFSSTSVTDTLTEDHLDILNTLVDILVVRIDGGLLLINILNTLNGQLYEEFSYHPTYGTQLASIVNKILKEKHILPKNFFPEPKDLESFTSLVLVTNEEDIDEYYRNLLKDFLSNSSTYTKLFVLTNNIPLKCYILSQVIYTCTDYKAYWLKLWESLAQDRNMYFSKQSYKDRLIDGSETLLVLGVLSVTYFMQTDKDSGNFLDILWEKTFDYYLKEKNHNNEFFSHLIPYMLIVCSRSKNEQIGILQTNNILNTIKSNKELFVKTLLTILLNNYSLKFVKALMKEEAIGIVKNFKEILLLQEKQRCVYDINEVDNLIKMLEKNN